MMDGIHLPSLGRFGISDLVIGKVVLEKVPSASDWAVAVPIQCSWTSPAGQQSIQIPPGLRTDLASVPQMLWPVVPPHELIARPAVMHDALYMLRPAMSDGLRITRGEADYLLYLGCLGEGMSDSEATQVYLAVRCGGSAIWHRHDAEYGA